MAHVRLLVVSLCPTAASGVSAFFRGRTRARGSGVGSLRT